jgi:asparagine synthase (glutamine-hydrolysing)
MIVMEVREMGAIFGKVGSSGELSRNRRLGKMSDCLRFRGSVVETNLDFPELSIGCCKHEHEFGTCIVSGGSGNIIAACEGELYNGLELSEKIGGHAPLVSAANPFFLVPELYLKFGSNFPRFLNGAFTIALWDKRKQTLLLIRDHLGSHSLFYRIEKDGVLFATTTKAIVLAQNESVKLLPSSVDQYFSSVALCPPATMFEGTLAVSPASLVQITKGVAQKSEYWNLGEVSEDYGRSQDDFADEVGSLFRECVKIRADFPGAYGTLVSGGVDTSAIASVLLQMKRDEPLNGFSINFAERDYSDGWLQEKIYSEFNIRKNSLHLGPAEFADALVKGVTTLDLPVNDVAYAGMFKAMELARKEGLASVFEGEGSDEIFCTGHSRGELSIQRWLVLPAWLRKVLFGLMFKSLPIGGSRLQKASRFGFRLGAADHIRLSTWIPGFYNFERRNLLREDFEVGDAFYEETRRWLNSTKASDVINKYQFVLTKMFLPNDLLYKNERMAAANGLSNRTPFIDYRLVEIAFQIPAKFKLRKADESGDGTKLILKKALQGLVPEDILRRKKARGFSQPTALWYRNELKEFAEDLLCSKKSLNVEFLNQSVVRKLYNEHVSGRANHDYYLNSIIILELWLRGNL